MERRIVQDVIPTQRKSIRDIPIPASREREKRAFRPVQKQPMDDAMEIIREESEHRQTGTGRGKKYFIIVLILAILGVIFFGANAFAHATVNVTLASESDQVSGSFVTSISSTSSADAITSSPIFLVKQGSQTLTATATEDVETKATGTIVVFNDYSTTAQKLIANTRFETSAGLIYRISQSVSVPGKTTKASVTTPGSVTVTVTADQVGSKYNIDLSDFTIPGFAGEPEFDGIFARSKTPMTGGYSGTRPVIDDADRSTAVTNIDSNLKSQIITAALSSVPDGYILYPGAYRIDYTPLADTISGNNVTINEQASLTGFPLKEDNISSTLATSAVKNYSGEPIDIANLGALVFATNAVPAATSSTMAFTLSGTAKFVWTIDADAFATQLAGKSKGDFTAILQGYPHVSKASVSFFPFWLGSFPSNPSDITIATTTSI